MKQAWLLVGFGVQDKGAKSRCLDPLLTDLAEHFQDVTVRLVFYGRRAEKAFPECAAETVLEELVADGVTHVRVCPVALTLGTKWRQFLEIFALYEKQFAEVTMLPALLENREACAQLAELLPGLYGLEAGDQVLLVGHGTGSENDRCYHEMEDAVNKQGFPDVRIALLHGYPSLEEAAEMLKDKLDVRIFPLLMHSAHHAQVDTERAAMLLTGYGSTGTVDTRGLLEYPAFRAFLEQVWEQQEDIGS